MVIIRRMNGLITESWPIILGVSVVGLGLGWLLRSFLIGNKITNINNDWQAHYDAAVRDRDHLQKQGATLRTSVEAQEAVIHQRDMAVTKIKTELESSLEKEKLLTRNVFTLRAEREGFKTKMSAFQNRMMTLQEQSAELRSEFLKSRDFYVGELKKSFDKRKELEERVENSSHEHESFRNLLSSSRSEQDSVNNMLSAAKARLENLDQLEHSVIALEAENAQLKHDNAIARQENDALRRDVAEQDELRIQNKELAQVLQSMEKSRKQYENDANRYRQHADKTEKKSETLRLKLDEVEQNFLQIEKENRKALATARKSSATEAANDANAKNEEKDDLQEIVGIGKVFEHTLHELGIFSFRQIANFELSDIARVNAELREFRGRMEQDDWIGQAKELLYKKYG